MLEDASLRELLGSLLVIACEEWRPCRESLEKIDSGLMLISAFTESIPTSSKLVKAVLKSTSGNVISDMLRQYASQVQDAARLEFGRGHTTIDVCPLSHREAQGRLHQGLSVMILKSALYAPQCGGHFDAFATTLLLEKQSLDCPAQQLSEGCIQRRPTGIIVPSVSMFEAVSTPRMDSVGLNWRDNLRREMSRDLDCRYEGVIRMVGEICRDLELRCAEIEIPLRQEQSRSRDLQTRLENSERDKAELESQARNHQSVFGALEKERACLVYQAEAAERRLKELGTSVDNIHQEFDHARIEAEHAAQAAIESARQQDLMYLATMTGKEEILEEQSLRLASSENHTKLLEHELNRMGGLEANNIKELKDKETHIETLNSAVSAAERHITDLQDELTRTKEHNACHALKLSNSEAFIEELNSAIVAVNEASDQNRSLISNLRDQLRKAEFETSELRSQHETYICAKDMEIERLSESHRSLNDRWQSELEVARGNAAAANDQFGVTIAGLHSKIRRLRKEREVGAFRIQTADCIDVFQGLELHLA